MLFSSVIFLFYFLPIVLFLYYVSSFSRKLQNGILLFASLFFYAWGEIKFVFIMVFSIIINYIFGLIVDKYREDKKKAYIAIVLMCTYNISILFLFKYLRFMVRNINEITEFTLEIPNIALPIGISFFTFQAISYVIDVYRTEGIVQKSIFYVGLYITFFPQLIAGPIVRYASVSEQIKNRKESWQYFSVGTCRFITGLAKKVLIANSMAIIADRIFKMNSDMSLAVTDAWLGSIAYTFQIFFDFSGYSDMAIGLGLMFGFKFEENFNYPYISRSINEFWRRWHISLSQWFRDYVYIPLGGSRVESFEKVVRNLLIVWILTGIWHGAEWTFVMWGVINFMLIVIEKSIKFEQLPIPDTIKRIYALFFINLNWVIFRAPYLREAGNYIACMFGFKSISFWSNYTYMFLKEYGVYFICAVIFSMPISRKINMIMFEKSDKIPYYRIVQCAYPAVLITLFMICSSYIVKGAYNPFIYFNF